MLSKALAWFNHKDRRERSLTGCSLFQKRGCPFANKPDVSFLLCPTESQSAKVQKHLFWVDVWMKGGKKVIKQRAVNTCVPGAPNIPFK